MEHFLTRNALDASFLELAARWYDPLVDSIALKSKTTGCHFLGISGSQGSGKSTLADYLATALCEQKNLRCAQLSIDDYYLPRHQRQKLAEDLHPLFLQRGVPGTHDSHRLLKDVSALLAATPSSVKTPLFSKQNDDPLPKSEWLDISTPLDVLILEGWCVGVSPQTEAELQEAKNTLEQDQDSDGVWRTEVNRQLAGEYQTIFQKFDSLVYLQAPDFTSVFNWRWEQEEKLLARVGAGGAGQMGREQLRHFLHFFQRLTEHGMQMLPGVAEHIFRLDAQRKITSYSNKV